MEKTRTKAIVLQQITELPSSVSSNLSNNNGHATVDNLLDLLGVTDEVIGMPPVAAAVDNKNLSSTSTNNNTADALFDLLGDLGSESLYKYSSSKFTNFVEYSQIYN